MPALQQWIAAEWGAWTTARSVPGPRLLLRGRKPGRLTMLIAEQGRDRPAVVVKVSTSGGAGALTREFEVLTRLQGLGASRGGLPVPAPLGRWSLRSVSAIAVGALRGRRLPSPNLEGRGPAARRAVRRYIRTVDGLSRRLAALGGDGSLQGIGDAAALAEEFAAHCVDGSAAVAAGAFAEALRAARSSWPQVWQHGDPAVGNLLVAPGAAAYVDWEAARSDCPPWLDLVTTPLALVHAAAAQRRSAVTADLIADVLGSHRLNGRAVAEQLAALWTHEIPLAWAVVLGAMIRERRDPGGGAVGGVLVSSLLADPDCRARVSWAAPDW